MTVCEYRSTRCAVFGVSGSRSPAAEASDHVDCDWPGVRIELPSAESDELLLFAEFDDCD